jgi:hypothetical protein
MSSGVFKSMSTFRLKISPKPVNTTAAIPKRKSELFMVLEIMSASLAPAYCDTKTDVAMVMPMTMDINTKVMGKLTDTAPRASGPKNCPTHMLSTVL